MGFGAERVDLIARIRKAAPDRALADVLRLDGRGLRFHLGTSLADLRIPVYVDDSVRGVFEAGVRDLFFLLALRHRSALRQNEYDRLILMDGFDPKAARQTSFNAPGSVKEGNVRDAFLAAPELHPALDGGLVASWLGSGRPGRVLVGTLNAILRRAHAETASREPPEPTAYLALLAIRSLSQQALAALREFPVSGPAGRMLHGAVASGVLLALQIATRESGILEGPSAPACEATATVLPWLGGMRSLWGSGVGAYGVAFAEAPPHIDQHVHKIAQGGAPEAVVADVAAELAGSKEARKKACRQAALAGFRSHLLAVVRMAEVGRAAPMSVEGLSLPQLYGAPGALEKVLATPAARKDLYAKCRSTAKAANTDAARDAIETVGLAAKEWKEDDGGEWVSQEEAVKLWSEAVAALATDVALDAAVQQAGGQLLQRQGNEIEGGIATQHEGGKLYLVGIEERPILMTRGRAAEMGHLFCDMKDFTKRTAFLKETVVADFLSREFYGPILTAAARHARGAAHLADKGGIYLNNLLGDAVSFSGDVVALLELAEDIRSALASYARRLDSEGSRETVAKAIATLEEKFKSRHQELVAAAKSAQEAQRRGTMDPLSGEEPGARMRALKVEMARLKDEREQEIALATGEKLEAGIFISYGAAPEVATFEDHIFGHIKVSIAEKINESARGTARNAGVRARVDSVLASERNRLGRPALTCPLQVSVSQQLSMPVPADVALAVRRSLAHGDLDGAETVLSGVVREYVSGLASQEMSEDQGDIYNGGAALSEAALKAYVKARVDDLTFLRRDLRTDQMAPALRERFVFPTPVLRLLLALSPASESLEQIFVYVGRALFRGFEQQGGLGVYEMVARENPFFALLAQHHLPGWLAEQAAANDGEPPLPPSLLRRAT